MRAAVALLEYAWRGIGDADMIHGVQNIEKSAVMNTTDVVAALGTRLRQIEASELPNIEKSRLTVSLADALLKAIGVDVIDKRLEAVQGVLLGRKAIAKRQDKR